MECGDAKDQVMINGSKYVPNSKANYYRLVIVANEPAVEIWLGDDEGYHVEKGSGTLETCLLPGNYTVEFGLGNVQHPIELLSDAKFTQAELAQGPTCLRRIPDLSKL
jgi:hypothetical protein